MRKTVDTIFWWGAIAVLALLVLAALGADLASTRLLGFEYDEVHAADGLMPPGSVSVPATGRTYHGDRAGFARLDPDGDGRFLLSEAPRLAEWSAGIWRPWKAALTSPEERLSGVPLDRLTGPVDWAGVDGNRDRRVSHAELVHFTAPLQLTLAELAPQDRAGDGILESQDYPGTPRTREHVLGTDSLGRDLLVRLIYGLRVTLLVALCATAIAFLLGSGLGLAAGITGGRFDRMLLSLLEVLQAVPFLFVVILLAVATRPMVAHRFDNAQSQALVQAVVLFCALGAVQWFSLARYARGLGASLRRAEYVLALQGMGYSNYRIVRRHLLPNTIVPLLAFGTLLVPMLVLEEAFLSFLGFGVQPPFPSLGVLLSDGVSFLDMAPMLLVAPALLLLGLTTALHVVAHRLVDSTGPGRAR